ncbi:MAG: site-2 protease family protein [Ignavibacteriae bacterium]|nr:MAG: site-2 protease family protein [Ignavibacteriota bacterium]
MNLSGYLDNLHIIPILIFSVVIHEMAHGWVALKCGDNTAKDMGRLTLNPVPHIDLFGSILVPLFSIIATGRVLIAWAKPVPIDPRNFSNYKRDDSLVTVAGPVSNLLIAFACSVMVIIFYYIKVNGNFAEGSIGFEFVEFMSKMFGAGIFLNVTLAIFNLIPIPPLDGSHLFSHLLPEEAAFRYRQIGFFGIFIILILFNYVPAFPRLFFTVILFFVQPYIEFIALFVPDLSQLNF